jgi:putative transposase
LRPVSDVLANARSKRAASDPADLQPKWPQRTTDLVLVVADLIDQELAAGEQRSQSWLSIHFTCTDLNLPERTSWQLNVEHQAGLSAAEFCRKYGISDATFYTWRKKYGGMEVSEARRLKVLEEENARLKKLLAELMMDVSTLREMLGKNVWSAPSMQGS